MVIEKPFGYDLDSATKLNHEVLEVFDESQVFRIDHYLGKETVQNMLALRFANTLFEPVWNRNFVDNVQITAAEDIGIGGRAGYYEGAGALRDLVQNHMLQLLALLTMEPPIAFEANRLRDEKLKVLEAIVPPKPEEVAEMAVRAPVRGRDGRRRGGAGVPRRRRASPRTRGPRPTPRCGCHISNWRWAGVPFYLRTGKRLARKVTEIAVTLKPVPHLAFQSDGSVGVQPNQIILTVQPDEGVSVSLGAKIPGPRMRIRPVNMEFRYGTSFMSESPEAYERLILDAMRGDATLFTRNDEIEALWGIIDPILTAWHEDTSSEIPQYQAGSAGPERGRSAARARAELAAAVSDESVIEAIAAARPRTSGRSRTRRPDRDRRRAAAAAARAPRPEPVARPGAGPEPGRARRPRLEGRDRQPPRPGRPLPRLAHGAVRGRAGPHARSTPGGDELRRLRRRRRGDARAGRDRPRAEEHLERLDTIIDPVIVSELPTMLWSPHGHAEAVESMRRMIDVMLLDSDDGDGRRRRVRVRRRAAQERLRRRPGVAAHDAVARAAGLELRSAVAARAARPDRADRDPPPRDDRTERAAARRLARLAARLEARAAARRPATRRLRGRGPARDGARSSWYAASPASRTCPGCAGVTVDCAGGFSLSLDRGPGGLVAQERRRR